MTPSLYFPASDKERRAAKLLNACIVAPRSWEKKFIRSVHAQIKAKGTVTDKQVTWLWRLVAKYKKQIKDLVVVEEAAFHDDLQKDEV